MRASGRHSGRCPGSRPTSGQGAIGTCRTGRGARVQHAHIERRDAEPRQHRLLAAASASASVEHQTILDPPEPGRRQQPRHDHSRASRSCVLTRISARSSPLSVCRSSDEQRVVGRRQAALRPLLVERRDRRLHAVDRGDKRLQVEARRLLLVLVAVRHDRDAPGPAELESHRHHDAGRERGRQRIGLAVARLDLVLRKPGRQQFGDQPLGVVAFRKRDRRGDMAEFLVLFEQPRALEIPPFQAVEQIVEAGLGERQHLLLAAPRDSRRRTRRRDRTISRHRPAGATPAAGTL